MNFAPIAAHADETSVYAFFDAGFSRYDRDLADESAAGIAIGVGYRLTEVMDLELAYNDYGPVDLRSNETVQGELEAQSLSLSVNIASTDITSTVSIHGVFGFEYTNFETEFFSVGTLGTGRQDEHDTLSLFGVGMTIEGGGSATRARLRLTSNADGDILRLALGVQLF